MTHLPAALAAFGAFTLAAQTQPNQPGTKWTDDELRQTVDVARVGRILIPKSWANRARVAVALTFYTDSEAPLLRDCTTSPTTLSASDFGAQTGIWRILDMVDRRNLPATFFVTGVDPMLHPEMLSAILRSSSPAVRL
jgi:hypothetical protein